MFIWFPLNKPSNIKAVLNPKMLIVFFKKPGEIAETRENSHQRIRFLLIHIRFIFDKLAEAERDNISRLMKITDIIRA
jgi:hypothetical protein